MHLRTALLCIILLFPGGAAAQWVPMIGEDASIPGVGSARLGVSGWVHDYDRRSSRAGDGTIEPLGADFSDLQITLLPGGMMTQDRIRELTGIPNLTLTLGDLDVRLRGRVERVPLSLELGVLRRLSVGVMLPIVRTRGTVLLGPGMGTGADAGLNPSFLVSAALNTNTTLNNALLTASSDLRTRLDQCLGSADPACAPINQDRAAAEAFLVSSEMFGQNFEAVYLNASVVPVTSSPADQAIVARLAAMRAQFEAYGVGALSLGPERPVGASPFAQQDLLAFISNPVFGIAADPLATAVRTGIGDVELGAKLLLVDAVDPVGNRPFGFRLLTGGLVRLGTGNPGLARNLVDIPTGDGQTDLEALAIVDAVAGRRLAVTASARFTRQLEHELVMRVPRIEGQPFVLASREARVRRELGNITSFEAVPRFALNEWMAVAGYYSFRSKGMDRHEILPDIDDDEQPPAFETGPLDIGTATREQRVGFGVAFSNLAAHRRGQARFPYEISYLHVRSRRATGAIVPHGTEDRIQLRLYAPVWR